MFKKLILKTVAVALCVCIPLAGCQSGGKTANESDTENQSVPVPAPEDYKGVTPDEVNADVTIVVSPLNADEHTFDGWGTSLCWWANRLGYSDALAQKSADLFYGEDGLRLNIMRYNIGGGDDPSHHHITRTDSAVPGWLVYDKTTGETTYNNDADANQLNVMERCVKAAGDDAIVEVFSNSPPYFMTVSGCSSGGFDPNKNNLKDDCYTDFAEYLAYVADYIQNSMGITVTSIEPMNEPNTNFWGANSYKQEGCHFDAGESQSKIIVELAKAMEKYELNNVIISASDETNTDGQINEYNTYSDEAKKVIGRINTHTYGTGRIGEMGALAKAEGFKLWMSEVDGNGTDGENAGEMGSALWFGGKIISDINALTPSAWVMWQAIDNHISKDGYNGNQDKGMVDLNGGFWGLAVADHDNEEIILTQKYYTMGQFTRYIRPGDVLIHCGGDSLASFNPETGTLSIVVMNRTAKDKTADISLANFKRMGTTSSAIRTSGGTEDGEHWAELPDIECYNGGFIAELKANSVTTFVIEGCEMGEVKLDEVSMNGAKATGSAPWNNGSDTPEKVIDGDTASFFDGVSGGWVEVELSKKTKFNVLAFAPRAAYEGRMLGGVFYGSDDGESWEEIYTVSSSPAAGLNYIFLPKDREYKYLRYDVAKASEYNGEGLANIAEIKLYNSK